MISSVSNNSSAVWQTGYSQRQSAAFSTTDPDQEVQQDPSLKTDTSASTGGKKTGELSESDLKVVSELKQRDAEVKAHEAAHLAAAGGIATGGASFDYQQGPDGIQYAIGGEVSI
ncbi:MAG: putative metalloprotease CJM1_0395 family protein, partial [Methylobacter sp.]